MTPVKSIDNKTQESKPKSLEQQKKEYQQYMDAYRLDVQEKELTARDNKAQYERMYYYLQAREIVPAFQKARQEDEEIHKKSQEDLMNQIQTQVAEQNAETPIAQA